MNTPFASLLTATGISLLSMVDPALADSVADTSRVAKQVILEAGEIDSSRVPTGSYVVVIHGKGERHPVSGEWDQLVTSRSYVHAVDAEVLTLFRGWDGEPEWIEVESIQTLVLMGSLFQRGEAGDRMGGAKPISRRAKSSSSLRPGNGGCTQTGAEKKKTATELTSSVREARDSTQVDTGRSLRNPMETSDTLLLRTMKGDMKGGRRIAIKLASGAFWGSFGGYVGVSGAISLFHPGCDEDGAFCGEAYLLSVLFFGSVGVTFGTAVGITQVDSYDRFGMVLIGSTVGTGVGWLTWKHTYGLSLLACPVLFAVTMSEKSRKPPESSRFSVGLIPTPGGGLSTTATLRF